MSKVTIKMIGGKKYTVGKVNKGEPMTKGGTYECDAEIANVLITRTYLDAAETEHPYFEIVAKERKPRVAKKKAAVKKKARKPASES